MSEPPVLTSDVVLERPGLKWGAVFGGAVTALGLWILLYTFGLAVGLSSINPTEMRSMRPAGLFAGIWAVIAPLIALFIGGWVAGRGAGIVGRAGGGVHGLVVWALTTIFGGALIVTALSAVVGGVASIGQAVAKAGGEAMSAVGQEPGGAAPMLGLDANEALRPVNDRLQAEGRPPIPAAALDSATRSAATTALARGRVDRQALAQNIATDTGLSEADASEVAGNLEGQYEQRSAEIHAKAQAAAQNAKAGALKVAERSGRAFWGVFGVLLLGLIAGVVGGAAGASVFPRPLRREPLAPRRTVLPPREVYP